ncbi:nuclear transport factor 2 family protein [Nocardia sp. NBC_01329]|uniref:nuclear transport factor 2 family protein n=1 Tax=Nocardia sp. NBC_01329 TaxID=2903594 RepID=UPI002E11764D|nr:nuclear transport factor 2 family protein [Nocardia sp. NBC_01329]
MTTTQIKTPYDSPEQEIRTLAENWIAAIVSNDATRIREFMSEDWVHVSDYGFVSAAHFLKAVGSGVLRHSAMSRIGDPRIQVYGDLAVYTARVTNTEFYHDERTDRDEWATDVYSRRGDSWICVLTQVTNSGLNP